MTQSRRLCLACSLAGLLVFMACAGEDAPGLPKESPQVLANRVNWVQALADFQGADTAKREAAAKTFLNVGSQAYYELAPLLKNTDAAIVKRANEIRDQINRRSVQYFNQVLVLRQKVDSEPLARPALDELNQTWIRCAIYAPQTQVKQACLQQAREAQQLTKLLDDATQELARLDETLKTLAPEQKVPRAAVCYGRANALKALQRDPEALAAAQQALEAGGGTCRHTPGVMKLMAEVYQRQQNGKALVETCRQIIQSYPRSLEARFAHQALLDNLSTENRWDEALAEAKAILAAFPVDEEMQGQVYSLVDALADNNEYKRAADLAGHLVETLPLDRVPPETVRLLARCHEYVLKDPVKARKYYELLREQFSDEVAPAELAAAEARIKRKLDGKFPAEPLAAEATPAGALARFLSAVRQRDQKALLAAVPNANAADYADFLNSSELAGQAVFADFVVTQVQADEKAKTATLTIEMYGPASAEPAAQTQTAVQEDGQWKMLWKVREEGGEE